MTAYSTCASSQEVLVVVCCCCVFVSGSGFGARNLNIIECGPLIARLLQVHEDRR